MTAEGVSIEGISYGGITPLDFSGPNGSLALWLRDDIKYYTGSYIKQWTDLSGYNRHAVPINIATLEGINFYANVINTSNGLAITGGDGNGCLAITSDLGFKSVLYDGRAMTLIIIFKVAVPQTNTGFSFLRSGKSNVNNFQVACPAANQAVRTLSGGTTIANNDAANVYSTSGGHLMSIIDTGYVSSSSNLHRKLLIDNVIKTERKFSAAPSSAYVAEPMMLQFGGPNNVNVVHEIILYDNTGKSAQTIIDEHTALYNQYIKLRYPNLFF